MFKALVILFISSVFALLAYKIFSELQQPKTPKTVPVAKRSEPKSPKVKHPVSRPRAVPAKPDKGDLSDTVVRPIKKVPKVATPTETSLAENIAMIGGQIGDPVFIRIFKQEAQLEVWMKAGGQYRLIQTYPICAFSGALGPKLREGDRQSPEGFYYVTQSRLNPNSRFHLSFNLGYPNRYDRAHGRTGSFLMVHGDCVSIGCYAMTDSKIEEIYELVEQALMQGQKIVRVHAFPFRMTEKNMQRHRADRWYSFWENLKEGYDWFEVHKRPPNVQVKQRKYIFD